MARLASRVGSAKGQQTIDAPLLGFFRSCAGAPALFASRTYRFFDPLLWASLQLVTDENAIALVVPG